MKKEKRNIVMWICLLCLFVLLAIFFFSCRKQTLDITMTATARRRRRGRSRFAWTACFLNRFFRPYRFRGRISVEGYELTFDEAYTNDILLQNGCGFLDYMCIDEEGVRDEFLGHIRMDGSGSLLILLYGESHAGGNAYICAPAGTGGGKLRSLRKSSVRERGWRELTGTNPAIARQEMRES